MSEIRRWLPEVGLSNVRLRPGPGNTLEVVQTGGRADKRGQFLFEVDGFEQSPEDLFTRARSADERGDIGSGLLHRRTLHLEPDQMLGVFAEFERSMIQERVRAGLRRAKDEGKQLGRPRLAADLEKRILDALKARKTTGDSVRKIAARFGVAASTVQTISRPFAGVSEAA